MAQNEEDITPEATAADTVNDTQKASDSAKTSSSKPVTAETAAADVKASGASTASSDSAENEREADQVSLEDVQNILNKDSNPDNLPKNVQKLLDRERESTRRVEEVVKTTKSNPSWFIPLFSVLLILGLAWVVVNYITAGVWPIPGIGNWNLLIGFGIMMAGFLMTMWWN